MNTKNALVTGASEGIGNILSKRLVKEGYRVTAVARSEEKLKELIASLGEGGHKYVLADLSDPNGIRKIESIILKERFDLLVNNAGYGLYGDFDTVPLEKIQSMTRLNCDALVALSHAFLVTAKPGDTLLNVASAAAFLPSPSSAVYAATKAFVLFFSEALWFEQKDKGVYVFALCPGFTSSKFHESAGGANHNKPSSLISQTPEEVVDIAISALKSRSEPTVITGIQNALTVFSAQRMPRKTLVNFVGNFIAIKK